MAQEDATDGAYVSREVVATVDSVGRGDDSQPNLFVTGDDGDTYVVDPTQGNPEGLQYDVNVGDRIIMQVIDNMDGSETAYFVDIVRTKGLWLVFAVFVAVILIVGLRRGFLALIGLGLTVAILFAVVFPRILAGADPVLTIVIAGIAILAVNLFLAHGFTKNALIAFASTSVGVTLAWVFGELFVRMAKLTGLGDEQSVFLYWDIGGLHAPVGLLLAGIILGAVGVLDDVAITQCETVAELKAANASFTQKELFLRGMRVGRHHIASTVNTLVLAYAGSALPLFLIFLSDANVSLWRFLNTEVVTEEIVRTLAGTSALVLVVPLTTFAASYAWSRAKQTEAKHAVHDEHTA